VSTIIVLFYLPVDVILRILTIILCVVAFILVILLAGLTFYKAKCEFRLIN